MHKQQSMKIHVGRFIANIKLLHDLPVSNHE